jgi:hypothetical protein
MMDIATLREREARSRLTEQGDCVRKSLDFQGFEHSGIMGAS